MEKILFGDNQFFGINHMSEEKARAQAMQFKDTQSIMRVLDQAYDAGIKGFMCTTHDRIGEIADIIRANPQRYPDFEFYPGMPYAHKYANSIGEVGMLETLKRFAPGSMVGALLKGAVSAVTQDIEEPMKLLVDAEMKRFAGLKTPVIFLQNVVTDLLLGLKMHEAFVIYDRYIREKYGAEPGYFTMNLPRLVDTLEQLGIKNPIVCTNVNKIGFRMSGGVDAYRELIASGRCRTIAMSIFASGAIPPKEAIEWVCGLEGLYSIVFGASSLGNIKQTKSLIDQSWGQTISKQPTVVGAGVTIGAPVAQNAVRNRITAGNSTRIRLLNVDIDNISMDELVDSFREGMLLTLHVDMIMKLQKDREFYDILPHFDVVTCDSQILIAASKTLGTPFKERVSGSDFFPRFYMKHKDDPSVTIFICGGAAGVAEIARKNINYKVGRDIVVGTDSPPLDYDRRLGEIDRMIARINDSKATVLMIGLGAGRQEKFIVKYRDRMPLVKLFLPLGGTIDYEANALPRPPEWITNAGFEWLYRLLREPRQRWHRYLVHQPPVLYLLARQWVGRYKNPFVRG